MESWQDLLEPVLPQNEHFDLLHIHSIPQRCRKLVFTSSDDKRLDALTTHYLVLVHGNDSATAVLSLEIFIYESVDLCTVFVSKADTTGHYKGLHRLNMLSITQALLRGLLRHYTPPAKRIRICLFAKAEQQYLFLGSVKNPFKHVLPDAALVKWWGRCLDGLHTDFSGPVRCALIVPGISDRDTAHYFPTNPRLPWATGDIFWDAGSTKAKEDIVMAVKRIPRFPDDPKSRFLDSIVADKRAKQVSRRQFWLELPSRQEFLLGKSVGIIGLEAEQVNSSLHQDCSKHNGSSKRDTNRFKELLVSLNFETLESTIDATKRLLQYVPEGCRISLEGAAVPQAKRKVDKPVVNTLNVVRKKPRRE